MKILLPVDGSAASKNAAKKAAEIAKKDGYTILMICVIKPEELHVYRRYAKIWQQADGSLFNNKAKVIDDDEAVRILRNNAEDMMESIARELNLGDGQLEKDILIGEPHEKILETAKNDNIDLIVMGNRGFSAIKRFFVGSVTQRVIAEATCPVLVIHTDAKD